MLDRRSAVSLRDLNVYYHQKLERAGLQEGNGYRFLQIKKNGMHLSENIMLNLKKPCNTNGLIKMDVTKLKDIIHPIWSSPVEFMGQFRSRNALQIPVQRVNLYNSHDSPILSYTVKSTLILQNQIIISISFQYL